MIARNGRIGGPRSRLDRRSTLVFLAGSVASLALAAPRLRAQDAGSPAPQVVPDQTAQDPSGAPFSFDILTDRMRQRSTEPYSAPQPLGGFLAELNYDDYRRINFRGERARWRGEAEDQPPSQFHLQAFHMGWLYSQPVHLHEVIDGHALPFEFSVDDFKYYPPLDEKIPADLDLPGVAGFRLNTPLNRADIFDEVVVFQGASYFRALGRGNSYGLSARGIAINTASGQQEEFPRFDAFWLERPEPGATETVFYASLDSPSVTGAYRFVLRPGEVTEMDVTVRLFFRQDVAQLGIAPLTSMYLLGENDHGAFDDYRPRVHDSEALVMNVADGDTYYRPLNNPPRLASSWIGARDPVSFGLVQRTRGFEHYLDGGAHYERRPSLMVQPLSGWGRGTVRLVEIPSDLEGNDNIVAFWVPEAEARRGDTLELSYRLHWGFNPPGAQSAQRARILRTLAGNGGISGVAAVNDRRKFVIDFAGGTLSELPENAEVTPDVTALGGEIVETVVNRIPGQNVWRLVIEVAAPEGAVVELRAGLTGFGRVLTETWLYQWMKE